MINRRRISTSKEWRGLGHGLEQADHKSEPTHFSIFWTSKRLELMLGSVKKFSCSFPKHQGRRKHHTSVDDKLWKRGRILVSVASMDEEETSDMWELSYAEVRGEASLSTFFTHNTDADVSGLDHRDVVTTIANCCHHSIGVRLQQPRDARLLSGWGATHHHCRGLTNEVEELELVIAQTHLPRRTGVEMKVSQAGKYRRLR